MTCPHAGPPCHLTPTGHAARQLTSSVTPHLRMNLTTPSCRYGSRHASLLPTVLEYYEWIQTDADHWLRGTAPRATARPSLIQHWMILAWLAQACMTRLLHVGVRRSSPPGRHPSSTTAHLTSAGCSWCSSRSHMRCTPQRVPGRQRLRATMMAALLYVPGPVPQSNLHPLPHIVPSALHACIWQLSLSLWPKAPEAPRGGAHLLPPEPRARGGVERGRHRPVSGQGQGQTSASSELA